jgi:hypothetical protein
MGLVSWFPATTWVLRQTRKLLSSKYLLIPLGLILAILAVSHIHSAIVAHRSSSFVGRLGKVQLARTTKAELLSTFPELTPWRREGSAEHYTFGIDFAALPRWTESVDSGLPFHRLAYLFGENFGSLSVDVTLQNGVVTKVNYRVQIEDGSFEPWNTSWLKSKAEIQNPGCLGIGLRERRILNMSSSSRIIRLEGRVRRKP